VGENPQIPKWNLIITRDTPITAGPGLPDIGFLPQGTVVKSVEQRGGWVMLESGSASEQYWVEESFVRPAGGNAPVLSQQAQQANAAERSRSQAAVRSGEVTWSWGPRLAGTLQVVGGAMEVALGIGGVVVPEPATTVGGIILIAHGSDTIIAGFRTLWSEEVTHSLTQTGATMAAEGLGASHQTARLVGTGVDLAVGIGPSICISVTRRLAIAGAEKASHRVAVAYLQRSALKMGHNAVGVKTGATTVWVHFAGVPRGAVRAMRRLKAHYIITELAVNGKQAARAVKAQQALINAGVQTWRYAGPNCTTAALQVLRQGGVVVPAWSVSPGLLHLGVRAGAEITFMAGAIGSTAPDFVPSAQYGGR
jgi:hypothetical protein